LAFVENGEENLKAPRLPADPVRQSLAAFALELARGFETPFNPAPESFRLLVRHLGRLARCSGDEAARLVSLDFAAKYLELAGFGPAFSGCLICGAEAAGAAAGWRWDPEAGGLYCPLCLEQAPPRPSRRPVSPAILSRLRPREDGAKLPTLTADDLAEAELFFEKLAEHQLGRPLKAMKAARRLFDKTGGRP
jgi:recombinational DNA repair protein (RecF pathway)